MNKPSKDTRTKETFVKMRDDVVSSVMKDIYIQRLKKQAEFNALFGFVAGAFSTLVLLILGGITHG